MNLKLLAEKFNDTLDQTYDSGERESIFSLVIEHYLRLKKSDIVLKKDLLISKEQVEEVELALTQLKNGKPIQYVLGEAYFYGLKFEVTPAVLIPRPETEELVEWIIETVKSGFPSALKSDGEEVIIDMGTGSGCIAISLKKNLASFKVDALDISEESLTVASKNAIANETEINFIHADMLAPEVEVNGRYSIVVSNPPYIKMDEKEVMHKNVLDFEPHHALFVSNENPLIFYEAVADFALQNLQKEGWLFFEINEYLGNKTIGLLEQKGFTNLELKKDMQGKERMIRCRRGS